MNQTLWEQRRDELLAQKAAIGQKSAQLKAAIDQKSQAGQTVTQDDWTPIQQVQREESDIDAKLIDHEDIRPDRR